MKHLLFAILTGLGLLSLGCSDLTSPSPITITKDVQGTDVSPPAAEKVPSPAQPGGVIPGAKRAPEAAPLPAAAQPAAGCGG